jgi:serine/threonine protein kinase/Leucine-rich repeat (LRR) protein
MLVDAVAHLVERLQRLRLLEPAQLQELSGPLVEQFPDPQDLARELKRRGWLTDYQAERLSRGRDAELVLGPYVLLERLGQGGMGQVFKARQRPSSDSGWRLMDGEAPDRASPPPPEGRLVALKIILQDYVEDPLVLRRFAREARAAAGLEHPNVVRAFDAGRIDDVHFFTMEYVEGTDLAALVEQRGPLPVAEACEYARQAALGLQHAFERGLVHRDVKPHNLLLTARDHVVKLLDLGLARQENVEQLTLLTTDGSMLGTPDYVAPEQARNSHEADIRADIYSLGCTLYFLLTGQPPFVGGSLTEKLLRHLLDVPAPLQRLRADAPAAVTAVVNRLMAKRAADRYSTPAEAAAALAAAAASLPPEDSGQRTEGGQPRPPVSGSTPDPFALTTALARVPDLPAPADGPRRRRWPWALGGLGVGCLALIVWCVLPRGGSPADGGRAAPKKAPPETTHEPTAPETAEQAADALGRLGASIVRDEGRPGRPVVEAILSDRPIGDADLVHLEALPELQTLDLASTRVSDAGLARLQGLKQLRKLVLRQTAIGDAGLAHLSGLSNLRELDLNGARVSDAGLAHLQGLTQLEWLTLRDTAVGDAGLERLEGLTRLVALDLHGAGVSDAGLAHLQGLTRLGELDLGRTRVGDAGLSRLGGLKNLRFLVLLGTEVSDEGLGGLSGLSQLEELHLVGTRVSGPGLARLKELTRLRVLSLNGSAVGDEGLAHLAGSPQLVQLGLSATRVSDAGLAHLKGLTALRRLDLSHNDVSDAGLAHLRGLSQLEEVRLGGSRVSEAGVQDLQQALPKAKIER